MKILHVIDSMHVGGAEVIVLQMTTQLKKNGHDVLVVCTFERGTLAGELEKKGIRVICLEKKSEEFFKTIQKLKNIFKLEKPDVIHTHNAAANIYAASAAWLAGFRNVINTRHGLANHPFSWLREIKFKISLWNTRKTVGICYTVVDFFKSKRILNDNNSVCIYNGISTEFSELRKDVTDHLRQEFNITDNAYPVLCTVARLHSVKNHERMISMAVALQAHFPHLIYLIVGDGAEHEQLEQKVKMLHAESYIHFAGNRSEDLTEIYDLMDVFFFLSKSEGLSMTLLEAMRQNKPVIASNVGGNPEVVETKLGCETGILINLEDSDAMIIDRITQMLSDRPCLKAMGKRGKARMQKLFTFERMLNEYENLYEVGGVRK